LWTMPRTDAMFPVQRGAGLDVEAGADASVLDVIALGAAS